MLGNVVAFNKSGATGAVAFNISKTFDRIYGTNLWNFRSDVWLISSFLSNRRLQVVLVGKSSQEYPVNAGVPQDSILGPTHFPLYIIDAICDIVIYGDDTTLYSKCDQVSDLW